MGTVKMEPRNHKVPPQEVHQILSSLPLFSCLSSEEIDALAFVVEVCSFEAEEEVVGLQQQQNAIHIVHKGECTVSAMQPVSSMFAGDFFGDELLLGSHVHSRSQIMASPESTEPLVTLSVSREKLEELNLFRRLKLHRLKNTIKRVNFGDLRLASADRHASRDTAAEEKEAEESGEDEHSKEGKDEEDVSERKTTKGKRTATPATTRITTRKTTPMTLRRPSSKTKTPRV
ncbi:unnamed protein product, partial [Polarella glacialis]